MPFEFNPGALAAADDPYALLAEIRAMGAVVMTDAYCFVTRYREANTLLRSSSATTGFIGQSYRSALPPGAAREEMSHRINFLDPPDHTRVRKLVSQAFTPRRVRELRPQIETICRRLLNALKEGAGSETGNEGADLIPAFSHQVPSQVISTLLGVPVEDQDRLTQWADRVAALLVMSSVDSTDSLGKALQAAEDMHAYLRALMETRQSNPQDDLLSGLLAARAEDGQALSDSELLSLAATLYSAGHRTTRDLFTNGLSVLLRHPDRLADFKSGRLSAEVIVEEFLRFETPTHYVGRMLTEPMTLGNVTIPANKPISVLLTSTNRDERVYENPDLFDPRRWQQSSPPEPPLSFAIGPHFCLGAPLARLEAAVMLETLFETFPNLQLTGEPLRFWHTGLFRGLHALPVRWGTAVS